MALMSVKLLCLGRLIQLRLIIQLLLYFRILILNYGLNPSFMKKLLIVFALFYCFTSNAQFEFSNTVGRLCAYDSTQTVTQLLNYELYQTENDSVDGEKIEQCISIEFLQFGLKIKSSTITPNKKLFIKSLAENEEEYLKLDPNIIYNAQADSPLFNNFEGENYATWTTSRPSIENDEKVEYRDIRTRIHESFISHCIPSSKFEEGQYLVSVLFEIFISEDMIQEDNLRLPDLYFEENYSMLIDYPETQLDYYQMVNDSTLETNWYNYAYTTTLVLHTQEGYPTANNVTNHTFVFPEMERQMQLDIFIDDYAPLYFQDYTYFIGSLLDDSTRHKINLILSDVDVRRICLSHDEA